MNPYEPRTERQWFVFGRARDFYSPATSEEDARWIASLNPSADAVPAYRDVTYGPMTEVEQ